jgi:hypothetical protein
MTRVSAIVVSYHTGPRLKECLYALSADPEISETIIVDNGNPEEMTAWLRTFCETREQTELLTGHGNIGFGAGINRGVEAASGEQILVINPDAVLRRGSVSSLQMTASNCTEPWIVGGKIFDLDGIESRGPRRRELTLWRATTSMLGLNTWTLEDTPPPAHAIPMPVISGAFFLSSKASLARLNGFDEGYFLHVEDVDLCRRCRELGGSVMYDPNAGALHYGSTSDAPSRDVAAHKADSLARYFKKFASRPIEKLMVAIAMPIMRLGLRLSGR